MKEFANTEFINVRIIALATTLHTERNKLV